MGVEYGWYDEDTRQIMRYSAEGNWNWNDFHKAVRMSLFTLHNIDQTVDVLLDLRHTQKLPAGALGHLRSIAKKHHPNLSGRAVIIGLDDAAVLGSLLAGSEDNVLRLGDDQVIYFVATEAEALAILR